MKQMVEWMSDNHVAANLLMILIILAGFLSLKTVKVEIFPEVAMDKIQISVVYPGASPEEIEESICIKIEEQIRSLDGIERIVSIANENVGLVDAEVELGQDVNEIKDKIKSEIDRITTFPESAEEPVIKEAMRRNEVLQVAVFGETDNKSIKRLAEKVRDDLLAIDGITQVDLSGTKEYEISIEVSESKLREYNLSFDQVTAAVRRGSLDLPGGKVTTESGEILLRTKSLAYNQKDYEEIILFSDKNGHTVKIKDIATVIDGFEEADLRSDFNGKPAALVKIFRVGDQSPNEIAAKVKDYVLESKDKMPYGIGIDYWMDQSRILQSRMDLLVRNALQGLTLVVLCLALFLEVRLALWVCSGIIISFIGSFLFMNQFDASINMISLFAFILVIGIVVDDAIVVGENIYTFREAGHKPAESSKKGVRQVVVPVLFSVSTTIVAFTPLLFVEGFMGKFMRVIPIIVISVLFLSLVESMLILPSHLAGLKNKAKFRFFIWVDKYNKKVDQWLEKYIQNSYTPFLKKSLKNRYLMLAISISIFIFATVGIIGSGLVEFVFFPKIEGDNMIARVTMPKGTSIDKTREVAKRIEEAAFRVREETDAKREKEKPSIYRNVYSIIGDQPMIRKSTGDPSSVVVLQSNLAEINVELLPSEQREFRTVDLTAKWRKYVGEIPGIETLTFQSDLLSAGADIQVELSANSFNDLQNAVEILKDSLSTFSGVFDIRDDFEDGKKEFRLKLKESAASFGITLSDLARQVRQGFYGDEALRIQRGKDEVKVFVRYPESERKSLSDIANMRVRTPAGAEVPFYNVAEVDFGRAYSKIKRANSKRSIAIIADVDASKTNANAIVSKIEKELIPEIQKTYPSLKYSYEGQQRNQQQAIGSLQTGFMIAMFAIYALLAIPFRSYTQPLVVMMAIPFGLVGAIIGHLIFNISISIMSMFGIVALAGIVVNDSLVLVDFINQHRYDKGESMFEAIVNACQKRFRPILLTSLTTFLGLFPMMLETSVQAQFLIPMALSLGFGVLLATVICLIIVPGGILILDDIQIKLKNTFQANTQEIEVREEL
jgi:multidrug efflux pump subunit AcrB